VKEGPDEREKAPQEIGSREGWRDLPELLAEAQKGGLKETARATGLREGAA